MAALADSLGPSGAVRDRLLEVARGDRGTGYSPTGVRSFPRGIDDFVGREQELAQLTKLAERVASQGLAEVTSGPWSARSHPVAVAVSGPPGTGKTTLALHAARDLADRFPDGQLVVDLRGMDEAPPDPAELMLGVLKALQVADRDLAKAGPRDTPDCTVACWPTSGSCWSSTTPGTRPRCARCCRAPERAWSW
ncbi:hypothetical protein OG746_45215 [Streptomyces sp. NBC_01016]|uniref:hypothetical protein n=1 Tax=Streptomyces sp. NBC_01016 TaxID=2903720 RepID=UPI00225340A8|nr:hypothetical protein [Streptomyces sp. NBC_01016]MCX4835916.1 hypothetical protein [Streptomyces sp. NBC_01016]